MAFRRRPAEPSLVAIRAAAQRIEVDPDRKRDLWFKAAEDWQRRAWEFYDSVGEAGYAANYMGNSLARLRAYVGVKPDPQSEPEPLQAEPPADANYTADEAEAASQALDRLESPLGGRSELQRRLGVNFFVAGDSFLVGQGKGADEEWEVYSSEQVRVDKHTTRRVRGVDGVTREVPRITLAAPGSTGQTELAPEATAFRLWRPHPRFREWADSPFRRAMGILEELDIATRATLGVLRNRLQGPGILLVPRRMLASGGIEAPNLDQDGQAQRTKGFARDLIDVTTKAIEDPASAAAQVPFIVGIQEDIWRDFDPAKHLIQWDRTPDEQTAKLRDELITRFAATVDLPAEIIKGLGDVNHWSAWFIGDEAYQAHVQPFAATIFDALTYAYLRPTLTVAGVEDVDRFSLWFDPTDLVADPDQAKKAMVAHDAFLISDEVARRDQGYSEDDAPEDDEVIRRLAIAAARAGRPPQISSLPGEGTEEAPPPAIEPTPAPPAPEQQGPEPQAALVASAKDRALANLATRLHQLDEGLLTEAHTRADAAMRRALERANSRLKALALRNERANSTVRRLVEGVTPESLEVGPALGEAMILTFTDDTDQLFTDAFGPYLAWWDERVGRTTDQALNDIATAGDLTDNALAAHVAELDADRDAAKAMLLSLLTSAAAGLLLKPEAPAGPGEGGPELVSPGLIREALARAGGGGEKATSLLTGDEIQQTLGDALIEISGYTWVYGDPASRKRPFWEHVTLDGMFFSDWSSDALGNAAFGFPYVTHFAPGDHPGCQCSVRYELRRVPGGRSGLGPTGRPLWAETPDDPLAKMQDGRFRVFGEKKRRVMIDGGTNRYPLTEADRQKLMADIDRLYAKTYAGVPGGKVDVIVSDQEVDRLTDAARYGHGAQGASVENSSDIFLRSGPVAQGKVVMPTSEFMPAAADSTPGEYVLAHEWGHVITPQGESNAGSAIDAILAQSGLEKVDVSKYAWHAVSNQEILAESFAEWWCSGGQTTNPWVRAAAEWSGWPTP